MEKQLQNYLHFYIGQQAEGFWNNDDGSKESEGIGSILKVSAENIRSYGPAPVVLLLPV